MSAKEDTNAIKKDQAHWQAQRKKARKTAIVLGLLAASLAVWSVVMVVLKAKG